MKNSVISRISIIVLLIVLLCSGCKKKEEAFLEEDFQEIEEENKDTQDTQETKDPIEKEEIENTDEEACKEVCVYVCGAVPNPGLYVLENRKRIGDAIDMAGGMDETADPDFLNQAELLSDGQMIKVLTPEEAEKAENQKTKEESQKETEEDSLININSATLDELMTLPGIGQSKAESIISYREQNGSFGSIEDIMNITGIKEGVFNKIKDYISVD